MKSHFLIISLSVILFHNSLFPQYIPDNQRSNKRKRSGYLPKPSPQKLSVRPLEPSKNLSEEFKTPGRQIRTKRRKTIRKYKKLEQANPSSEQAVKEIADVCTQIIQSYSYNQSTHSIQHQRWIDKQRTWLDKLKKITQKKLEQRQQDINRYFQLAKQNPSSEQDLRMIYNVCTNIINSFDVNMPHAWPRQQWLKNQRIWLVKLMGLKTKQQTIKPTHEQQTIITTSSGKQQAQPETQNVSESSKPKVVITDTTTKQEEESNNDDLCPIQ